MFEWITSNPEQASIGLIFMVAFFWLLREKFQSHKERIADLKESVKYYRDKSQELEKLIFNLLSNKDDAGSNRKG